MKPKLDSFTIVLAGAWNHRIFSPEWLCKHVFETDELSIEFPAQAGEPYRYGAKEVRITPGQRAVVLVPQNLSDATLIECERQARKILGTLVHTPVSAVGTNFGFVESEPSEKLTKIFELTDAVGLAIADATTEMTELTRRLTYKGEQLNLRLQFTADGVTANFNFHRDVPSTAAGAEVLEGAFIRHRDVAIALLESVYDIHPSQEPALP